METKHYALEDLKDLPVLSQGQTCDLKIEEPNIRVWLCRCGQEDGMPYDNQVSIEALVNGEWMVVDEYEAV